MYFFYNYFSTSIFELFLLEKTLIIITLLKIFQQLFPRNQNQKTFHSLFFLNMPEKQTLQRKNDYHSAFDRLLPLLNKEQLKHVYADILNKTHLEIDFIFNGKNIEEIRSSIDKEIKKIIEFSFSYKADEDPEILETFQKLSAFILRSPTLPIHGMAFRYVEYDNLGEQEAIQWILSCSQNPEFNLNITKRIDLRETTLNILAQAALRKTPTIIKLTEEKITRTLQIGSLHIHIEQATPENFNTHENSINNGYCEILCIPLIGKIFNAGLLTIFSKRPFDLNNPDTLAEIETIQSQANTETQALQEKRFFQILNEINSIAENEREAIEKILKIMVGREGSLRCSIASFWKNKKNQIITQKSAAYPPDQHGSDQGDFLSNRPLIQKVVTDKEPLHITSPAYDPLTAYLSQPGGVIEKCQLKSIFALPVKNTQGNVTDVIVFDSSQTDIFTTEKKEHLKNLVNCMEKIIHIAREMRRYRTKSGEQHDVRNATLRLINQVFKLLHALKTGNPIKESTLTLIEKDATLIHEIEETLVNVNKAKEGKNIEINPHSLQEIYREISFITQQMQIEEFCTLKTLNLPTQTIKTNLPILKRILLNLFSNTQKHGIPEDNQTKVKLECSFIINPDTHKLEIKISNPGHIPNENLEKVFEPFFSTKNNLQDQFLSDLHGQGLDMVKNMLRAIQGEIEIDNHQPKIVSFVISIPLA